MGPNAPERDEDETNQTSTLVFFVNGKKITDNQVQPEWTLLYYLRTKLRLCGTKLGCGEGGCGACTVMISKMDRSKNKVTHLPVNACLAPICSMHGLAVTTVEGIGSTKTRLHPVQERIAKAHGSQCGFCTPGIVMSMYTLLRNTPKPNMKDLEVAFQGNLCRCTGYRPIIEGFKTFTEEWELVQRVQNGGPCAMGDKCCKNGNGTSVKPPDDALFQVSDFKPFNPSQEPIFPPELKLSDQYDKEFLVVKGEVTWYRPTSLHDLLRLKKDYPQAKIVVGNTEVGVEVKFKHMVYPVIIQPVQIPEMTEIRTTRTTVRVGASTTLDDLQQFLTGEVAKQPEHKTRVFKAIADMLNWFAGKQIRSVGALGSNIMTGSPISDMLPILMANRVLLDLQSQGGARQVRLDNEFFTGYRKTVVQPDEVLVAIHIPYSDPDTYCYAYKQARRREDDIAIVNTAVVVSFEPTRRNVIRDIAIGFGGMSFKTVLAPKTQDKLKGLEWNRQTLELAYTHLLDDLPLDPSAPGGMIQYRRSLSLSLFFRAFLQISARLQEYLPGITVAPEELSGIHGFHGKEYKSSQYFTVVPQTQEKQDALYRPLVHMSAFKQATGEAIYCDDIPTQENELYLAFVTSTKAHARIISIDAKDALAIEGVYDFISSKDLSKEHNKFGSIVHDEKVFYDEEVTAQGQIIGAIVAIDQSLAQRAARIVKIDYEELQPVIVTIQDAIRHNSYFHNPSRVFKRGDIEEVFKAAPHVIEGECQMGGQEHFYLETQCCLVVPKKEDYELEVFSSTQNPSEVTSLLAEVLGIQQNKIVTRVKRLGGGFGGKESKALIVAIPVAIAATKLNRPVRCMLDRDEDMLMTGTRHPFLMKYKIAFDSLGKILGVHMKIYNNCGYSVDLSPSVLDRAVLHFENSYNIPVFHVEAYTCKTNLPSNTAFRGFGGPQGMFATESMVEAVANYLNKDSVEVRQLNLYREGDVTPYNQPLVNCTMDKCWQECLTSFNYHKRRQAVEEFNANNRYKKRGLSCIPTKFGIAFTALFLNQSGALVLVYTDGSVLLSHGGVEMGQGLHTKMIQVASRALGVSPDKIHISETSTDKVPNTSPTAASAGSDLNGMAVLEACQKINARLQPYKDKKPEGQWEEWVKAAYFDRVSLSATGFHKTPDIGYDWNTGKGNMFNYFTYGVGCCEVEVDTLTGDHEVRSVEIVMDLGESINPAIDIGQIEGGFMQGYGLFVLEEMVYSPTGTTYTRGPGTYKIPGFGDIPGEFNVSLLKGVSNPRAIVSSKAVGEPPLFLGSCVLFAIRDAINGARLERGLQRVDDGTLTSPATAAKIRMACQDGITDKIPEPVPGSFKPWSVTGA